MGNKLHDLGGVVAQLSTQTPSVATAVTAKVTIGRAPFDAKVAGAYWIPEEAISGAATNNRAVSVQNAGSAGAGSAVLASITFTAGVDAGDYEANALTLASDPTVDEGDVIVAVLDVNGSGEPAGRGQIVVELQGA